MLILARWIHLMAGIIWIGLLYFFNLVNPAFLGELDPKTRGADHSQADAAGDVVVPLELSGDRAGGHWLLEPHRRHGRAQREGRGRGGLGRRVIGSFFVIWTLAFAIEMGLLMSPAAVFKRAGLGSRSMAIVIAGAAYVFLALNQTRLGEQSRAVHRHRRRAGLVHDAECVGHRLAHAEEDHPLECRGAQPTARPMPPEASKVGADRFGVAG